MVRIVYGVSGEGSGHSSRAREIARHLVRRGHEVRIATYDRGVRNLRDEFDVFETEGLRIATRDNQVSIVQTFTENLSRMPEGSRKLQQMRRELFKEFQPDCVLTDFEPMSAYLAQFFGLPLLSIDNQHRMRYVDFETPPGLEAERHVTRTIIRLMVPRPDAVLVTTFRPGRALNDFTFQFPPIVRQEIREVEPVEGEHILVYLTRGFESLVESLNEFPRERFIVYGDDRDGTLGNIEFRRPSRDGFLRDLASCRGVIGTAGFTLIAEALFLKKPYLATPMTGQFEQELNAYQLQQSGYGLSTRRPDVQAIAAFLYQLPDLRRRLDSYAASDNSAILAKVDELLDDNAKLLREFQRRRES